MEEDDIVEELRQADKWLGDDYKNSNYYRDYLKKVAEDLIEKTYVC